MEKVKISIISVATIISFIAFHSAMAAPKDQIASLNGVCKKLIVADKDKTSLCAGKILQSIHSDGRVGFYVITKQNGDAMITTFSGFDGKKPDPDTQIEDLDSILINSKATNFKPDVISVKGTCVYHNPYKGPTLIKCQASDEAHKSYQLEFQTDGSEPDVSKV